MTTCPTCGTRDGLMVNSLLCHVCYRAALRGVEPAVVRQEDREYLAALQAEQAKREARHG